MEDGATQRSSYVAQRCASWLQGLLVRCRHGLRGRAHGVGTCRAKCVQHRRHHGKLAPGSVDRYGQLTSQQQADLSLTIFNKVSVNCPAN